MATHTPRGMVCVPHQQQQHFRPWAFSVVTVSLHGLRERELYPLPRPHNRRKVLPLQAGAADQPAVHIRLTEQFNGIARFDAPPVQNMQGAARPFAEAVYQVEVANPDHFGMGVHSMTVDGHPLQGNVAPFFRDWETHRVEVVLGS